MGGMPAYVSAGSMINAVMHFLIDGRNFIVYLILTYANIKTEEITIHVISFNYMDYRSDVNGFTVSFSGGRGL